MIVVNGRFLVHRITGVERFANEILSELDKIVPPGRVILAIPSDIKNVPCYKNIKVEQIGILRNRLWENISFPLFVLRKKGLSLNLCNTAPLINPGIVCIHDVKIRARPNDFTWKFKLWYNLQFYNTCKRAVRIITVSGFSAREICRYYSISCNRIEVVSNAWQHCERLRDDNSILQKNGLVKGGYLFSLCSLEPNKNIKWIIEVAKKNKERIIAVAGSVNTTIFSKTIDCSLPSNLVFLGYVTDEEAKSLMKGCWAFLLPSFYEGFGIPPLEAISLGVNHIALSNIPAFKEIYDQGIYYFNPNNAEDFDIAQLDKTFITDNDRAYYMDKYSWEKSAQKLKSIIEPVLFAE